MLIKCPRCSFQQPKDQYCAQCGVDMENFKPIKPSFFQSTLKNPLVHLSLLLAAVAGVGSFIYQQNQEKLDTRVEYLKSTSRRAVPTIASDGSQKVVVTPNQTADPSSSEPTNAQQAAALDDTAVSEMASSNGIIESASPPPVAPTPGGQNPQASVVNTTRATAPHLLVTYAEVGLSALNAIMNSSRNTGQFMSLVDYTAGILPGIQRVLNSPDVTVLRTEERSLETNRSFSWFLGTKLPNDPNQEIGLTTLFELNDIEQNVLRGNLEILRSWREPGYGEPQKKAFPAQFEITPENGFFMAGILPPTSGLTNESSLTKIDLYKILNSARFKANQSELVIFVQFQKAP